MELSRYRARLQAFGLALVAMLAVGVLTSSAASAAIPTFKLTAKTTKFTTKSGTGQLESSTGEKIECASDSGTGEITGELTVGKVVVVFNGCTGTRAGRTCKVKSVGAGGAEEIVIATTKGETGEVPGHQ